MPIDRDLLPAIDRVILAVHGVRTAGEWTDTLHTQLRQDPRFDKALYLTLDYPWMPAVIGWALTWLPWARHWLTSWVQRQLQHLRDRYPNRPVSVICHSNGSWIVGHGIRLSFQTPTPLPVQTLILVGGVLHATTVCELVNGHMAAKLVNYWSSNDHVVNVAPPPFGKCGLGPVDCDRVVNRGDWHLGHSGYWSSSQVYRSLLEDLA